MTDAPPPIKKTIIVSGEVQVEIQGDDLSTAARTKLAIDTFEHVAKLTRIEREKMELGRR